MRVSVDQHDNFTVNRDDLNFLINVLRATLANIDEFEFETRLGFFRNDVESLVKKLKLNECLPNNTITMVADGFKNHRGIYLGALLEDDCRILIAAMNEVCNGISLDNFAIQIGTSREYICKLMDRLEMLLENLENNKLNLSGKF